jgi:hypothetical protein
VTPRASRAPRPPAKSFTERGAHYPLIVKRNQSGLYAKLAALPWRRAHTTHPGPGLAPLQPRGGLMSRHRIVGNRAAERTTSEVVCQHLKTGQKSRPGDDQGWECKWGRKWERFALRAASRCFGPLAYARPDVRRRGIYGGHGFGKIFLGVKGSPTGCAVQR